MQAVRSGRWKLVLPAVLYDLKEDIGETKNLAAAHPDVVRHLAALAGKARQDLGDGSRTGKGQRPAGRVANPKPQLL